MIFLYIIAYLIIGVCVSKIVYMIAQDPGMQEDEMFTVICTLSWPLWVVFGPIAWMIAKGGPSIHRWVTGQTGKRGKHE